MTTTATGAAGGLPLLLAHRGDWRVAPENTLAALTAAMRVPGCDGVEFDVQLSRDGVPVVIHDDTLDRVQGRPGRVDAMDAAELVAHGIPMLADVMAALPDAWMDVELKGATHGEATAAVLRASRGGSPENAIVSSFDPPALVAMADALPGWARWLNIEEDAERNAAFALDLGCRGVSVEWRAITPAFMRLAREGGLDVAAWTVRRRATVRRLGGLGVVACCVEAAALDGPY